MLPKPEATPGCLAHTPGIWRIQPSGVTKAHGFQSAFCRAHGALCDLKDIHPSLRGYFLIQKTGKIITSLGLCENC